MLLFALIYYSYCATVLLLFCDCVASVLLLFLPPAVVEGAAGSTRYATPAAPSGFRLLASMLQPLVAEGNPKMAQDRPKMTQDRPKVSQDKPQVAQDRPKMAQDMPKAGSR